MPTIPILTKLTDAQQMHREYPDTFEAPSAHELAMIKPGYFVKLCRDNERFWVRVVGATGKYLIGEIDSETLPGNPARGAVRRFETRHVYTVLIPPAA